MKRLRVITFAFACSLMLTGAADAQRQYPIRISIHTDAHTYKVGQVIQLHITLTNVSDRTTMIFSLSGKPNGGQAQASNDIVVRDASGTRLPRTDWPYLTRKDGTRVKMPIAVMTRKPVSLAPGVQFHDFSVLNREFDLTKPGKYSVTVRRDIPINHKTPNPKLETAKSNTIHFKIIPASTKSKPHTKPPTKLKAGS